MKLGFRYDWEATPWFSITLCRICRSCYCPQVPVDHDVEQHFSTF